MKRLYNYLIIVVALILVQGFLSCSTDDLIQQNVKDINDLKFEINVNSPSSTRTASDGKTVWTSGDKIIIAVDGNKDYLCMIEYDGTSWQLNKLSNSVVFKEAGQLNAVFADSISYNDGSITTVGDILYTKSGIYSKTGDVVIITLNMNQRPVAKIKVNGLPDGFWIDQLNEYTSLNISDVTWNNTNSKGLLCSEKEEPGNYTFFGTLQDNNGSTTFRFINSKGASYTKTFVGKKMVSGDFISISGPLVSEGWESVIPVEGLQSTKQALMIVNGTDDIFKYFEFIPQDATERDVEFTSSNNNIVTIDKDGKMTAKALGEASITVKTKGKGYTCTVNVKVINLTSYVYVQMTGVGTTMSNYGISYSRTYTVYNNSPVDIYIVSISTSNTIDIGRTVTAGSSTSITLNFNYNVYPVVTVKFKYGNNTYSVSTQ